jgi:hypothetical protein
MLKNSFKGCHVNPYKSDESTVVSNQTHMIPGTVGPWIPQKIWARQVCLQGLDVIEFAYVSLGLLSDYRTQDREGTEVVFLRIEGRTTRGRKGKEGRKEKDD